MSQTRDQQRFTISEVAADWHEPGSSSYFTENAVGRTICYFAFCQSSLNEYIYMNEYMNMNEYNKTRTYQRLRSTSEF